MFKNESELLAHLNAGNKVKVEILKFGSGIGEISINGGRAELEIPAFPNGKSSVYVPCLQKENVQFEHLKFIG